MELIGAQKCELLIQPGTRVNIDAMVYYHRFLNTLKPTSPISAPDVPPETYSDGPGHIDFERLRAVCEKDAAYHAIDGQIVASMRNAASRYAAMGCDVLFVWDGFVKRWPRKVEKLPRPHVENPPIKFSVHHCIYAAHLLARLPDVNTYFSDDEGERACVRIPHDIVVTKDSDAVMLGANIVLTDEPKSRDTNQVWLGWYLTDILVAFNNWARGQSYLMRQMTRDDLLDICFLLGSDYNERLPRNGPVTVCKNTRINRDTNTRTFASDSKFATYFTILDSERIERPKTKAAENDEKVPEPVADADID